MEQPQQPRHRTRQIAAAPAATLGRAAGGIKRGRGGEPRRTIDPRVAVVVITHNRVDEVIENLGRLARLPKRPLVVVVDNASTDGTRYVS